MLKMAILCLQNCIIYLEENAVKVAVDIVRMDLKINQHL